MTEMTKQAAREEALKRWRALPADQRRNLDQAKIFAAALAEELDFRSMANTRKLIFAWLARDVGGHAPWGNIRPESG